MMVADFNKERLAQARSFGCESIDLSQGGTIAQRIEQILKVPEVDCAVDCVGFEARSHGEKGDEAPATRAYACPMHPDYTSIEPGTCPHCGMKLAAADPGDALSPRSRRRPG